MVTSDKNFAIEAFEYNCIVDYLVKPFSMEELLLRIQVFLKRNKKSEQKEALIKLGKYQFHHTNMELILGDKVIRLTRKEGELLRMLIAEHMSQGSGAR